MLVKLKAEFKSKSETLLQEDTLTLSEVVSGFKKLAGVDNASLSHTNTHTLSRTLSLSLSLTHTHTHPKPQTPKQAVLLLAAAHAQDAAARSVLAT